MFTKHEAQQAVATLVGAPWTAEDVDLRESSNTGFGEFILDAAASRIIFVSRDGFRYNNLATVTRANVVGVLVWSAMERGVELPYDRVLREKAAAWAAEKTELEERIQVLEDALKAT